MESIANFESLTSIKNVTRLQEMSILETELEELQNLLYFLREHNGFHYLLDVFAVNLANCPEHHGASFYLNYLIKNLGENSVVCVRTKIFPEDKVPSNGNIWLNCLEKERLLQELIGVPFEFDLRPSMLSFDPLDLFENEDKGWHTAQSCHPLLSQDVICNFEIENNSVQAAQVVRGFSYLGRELAFQGKNSNEVLMQIGRVNCRRSFALESLWSSTIEKELNLEITDRAKAIRMLFLELERILDHFNFFSALGYEIGNPNMQQLFQTMVQRVSEIIPFFSGNKSHVPINCIGGIRYDIPRGWVAFTNSILEEMSKVFHDFIRSMEKSSLWKDRINCGPISSEQALDFGISGPNLRASGINYDLRKNSPYYFYSDVEFIVPVGQRGTVLDRFLVRTEEVFQSLKIIVQVLDNIPTGSIVAGDINYFRTVTKDAVLNKDLYMQTALNAPPIAESESLNFLEGSNGYLGLYVQGDTNGNAKAIKIISGDQCAQNAFERIVIGTDYEDVMLVYNSLNIHIAEVEK